MMNTLAPPLSALSAWLTRPEFAYNYYIIKSIFTPADLDQTDLDYK